MNETMRVMWHHVVFIIYLGETALTADCLGVGVSIEAVSPQQVSK